MSFVHLRNFSSYSLSRSALKIDDLVNLCVSHNLPSVAITDYNNLFGSLEFCMTAAKKGLKPIIGCTIDIQIKDKDIISKKDKIVLLVKDSIGYSNLLDLMNVIYNEKQETNCISLKDLKQYSKGLIALTAGHEGALYRFVAEKNYKDAEQLLVVLKSIFEDNLYIEIVRRNIAEEDKNESYLIEYAYRHNIALVGTNLVFFASPEMHEAHDALLCIADGKYIDEDNREKSNKESYFKSPSEMKELFADIPEAYTNTILIAKRCSFICEPKEPMLPKIHDNEKQQLIEQAQQGLEKKLRNLKNINIKQYHDRLQYELKIITEMQFSGYFLIVSDFIRWSKANNVPVGPGRGSGAGSLVAYCLEITDLDPIRFNLIFERFLNPERISMPDFDIDFCQEKRDQVINYVVNKYGKDRVGQIITFGKLQAKAVIRDVGRVMQLPYSQVDRISKMVPFNAVNPVTLAQAIEMEPMLQKARDSDTQIKKLLDIALQLEGLHRHASTHAAGIVIAPDSLKNLLPVYKDQKSDMIVVQYSMKYAELAGLVKFDFLGLKTLTVISNSCKLIKENNPEFSLDNLSLEDEKTFKLLSNGNSSGVFQFESSGMKDSLRKLKPDNFVDIMALGALYRPGPMDNIPVYISCKHKKQDPDYMHPKLEEILKETYGVIIYQEQVLQAAQKLSGYSLGSADLLRRAMGKKIKAEMDAQRDMFVKGAVANNIDYDQASKIFDKIAKFAGYGFNRAHAAAYAMISYHTAYLKANYPKEFKVACLNTDINDTDKISMFCLDVDSDNICEILPPDINVSNTYFSIIDGKISFALGAIKNVGISVIELLIEDRITNGNFKDIFDFVKRLGTKILNKRLLEGLIKSGSLDSIHKNRKQLFESVEILLNFASLVEKEKNTQQLSLFANLDDSFSLPHLINTEDWSDNEKINYEYESFGFYLKNHPLDKYKDILQNTKVKNTDYLKNEMADGYFPVTLVAVPMQVKTRTSARGRFVSMLVSDYYGTIEVSIFDDKVLESSNDLINNNIPICIYAEARKDEGGIRITANRIELLNSFLSSIFKAVKIYVNSQESLKSLKQIIDKIEVGNSKIYIAIITDNNDQVELEIKGRYNLEPDLFTNIEKIPGIVKIDFA